MATSQTRKSFACTRSHAAPCGQEAVVTLLTSKAEQAGKSHMCLVPRKEQRHCSGGGAYRFLVAGLIIDPFKHLHCLAVMASSRQI